MFVNMDFRARRCAPIRVLEIVAEFASATHPSHTFDLSRSGAWRPRIVVDELDGHRSFPAVCGHLRAQPWAGVSFPDHPMGLYLPLAAFSPAHLVALVIDYDGNF